MKKRIIEALKKCAKAHKVECNVYDEDENDVQVAIMSDKIPVVADVRMIVEAFYGRYRPMVTVDHSWGYVNVLLDYMPMRAEVDEDLLAMALPYGTRI